MLRRGRPKPVDFPTITPSDHVPELAPEIIDHIIDHLHDDKHTLRACSLVCKAWVDTAQFHLIERLKHAVSAGGTSFDGLIAFLQKTPRIALRVQELHVFPLHTSADNRGGRDVSAERLLPVLALLPRLNLLRIRNLNWTGYGTDPEVARQRCEEGRPTSLHTLMLQQVTMQSGHNFRDLISLFKPLRQLITEGFWIPRKHLDAFLSCPIPDVSLESLQLDAATQSGHMIQLILLSKTTSAIRYLDVTCSTREDTEALQLLLNQVGPQLCSLRVALEPRSMGDLTGNRSANSPLFDLSCCTTLPSFQFAINMNTASPFHNPSSYPAVHPWSHVIDIFRHLPPRVETVQIDLKRIDSTFREDVLASPWAELDLKLSQYDRLREVTLSASRRNLVWSTMYTSSGGYISVSMQTFMKDTFKSGLPVTSNRVVFHWLEW